MITKQKRKEKERKRNKNKKRKLVNDFSKFKTFS